MALRCSASRRASARLRQTMYRRLPILTCLASSSVSSPETRRTTSGTKGVLSSITVLRTSALLRSRTPRTYSSLRSSSAAMPDKHKMAKHFALDITDTSFSFARKTDEITVEAALDGLYVVRTSLPAAALDDTATVRSYKSLSLVERAFRCIKTVDLQIRPVYHWL